MALVHYHTQFTQKQNMLTQLNSVLFVTLAHFFIIWNVNNKQIIVGDTTACQPFSATPHQQVAA